MAEEINDRTDDWDTWPVDDSYGSIGHTHDKIDFSAESAQLKLEVGGFVWHGAPGATVQIGYSHNGGPITVIDTVTVTTPAPVKRTNYVTLADTSGYYEFWYTSNNASEDTMIFGAYVAIVEVA